MLLVEDASTGRLLRQVNVHAVAYGSGTSTGNDGAALLDGLPVGSVTLRVAYAEYEGTEVTVVIPAGGLVVQRVRLAFVGGAVY
ncbi:MAG TPA: carboxypeptidase regulatory-like domain-containing protein [Rubricoccaceae bacterium]